MDEPKKIKENLLKADLAPQLWDSIRFDVDHRPGNGHYILTGSSVPVEEEEEGEEKQQKISPKTSVTQLTPCGQPDGKLKIY